MTNTHMTENVDILIVEDDEIDAEAVRRSFRKHNLSNRLFHARYGTDALQMMRGQGDGAGLKAPVILIVDVNMPQMNGIEFLQRLRQDPDYVRTTAFMLSTSRREADIAAAYRLGIGGYFLKDNLEEFVGMLGIYLHINKFMQRG